MRATRVAREAKAGPAKKDSIRILVDTVPEMCYLYPGLASTPSLWQPRWRRMWRGRQPYS